MSVDDVRSKLRMKIDAAKFKRLPSASREEQLENAKVQIEKIMEAMKKSASVK